MTINVLVFPCGSEIGLEVYRSLHFSRHFHLLGAGSVADHGAFVFEDYIGNLPFITEAGCVQALAKIIHDRKVQLIIPATDSAILILKEAEESLGCHVMSSRVQIARWCHSKKETYLQLKGVVPVPKIWNEPPENLLDYPLFLKPDNGHSSIGTRKCKNAAECLAHQSLEPGCLILEYLPGEEYTIDCFSDRHGVLRFVQARLRQRIQNGISVSTSVLKDQEDFLQMAKAIHNAWKLRGAWFFQAKRNSDGKLVLMEVASRIAGSSGICRAQGINLVLLSAFDAMDQDLVIPQAAGYPLFDRALENRFQLELEFNTVYCDYDDCLVIDEQVNTQLVAFLYHCHNKGKEVVLISRHKGNLIETLTNWRLLNLFHRVIHIQDESSKAAKILDGKAIFIDDSFAERQLVNRVCGIPVFSPEAVEALF